LFIFFLSQTINLNAIKTPVWNKAFNVMLICLTILVLSFYTNTGYLSHHFLQSSNYLKKNNIFLAEKHLKNIEQNFMPYCHKGSSTNNLTTQLHLKKSEFLQAEQSIKKQLEIHPYNFNFWFDLGVIYEHQQKIKQAKTAYKKTLLYNCDYIQAKIKLLNIGLILKDENLVQQITNELTIIDAYLKLYQQNKVQYQKINKAVMQRDAFRQFKIQRDSLTFLITLTQG